MSRPVPDCGTVAAYARHVRFREPVDSDCRAAHADYMRDFRASTRNGAVRMVPAIGVVRRIQGLMAMGFTGEFLAGELGVPQNLLGYWYRKAKVVHVSTHERVDALFRRLDAKVGPSKLSLERARRKGWPTTFAWDVDTIDKPGAQPVGVRKTA